MPIRAGPEAKPLVGALQPVDDVVEKVCEELRAQAEPLCRGVEDTELPPLRAINHTIPLIDPNRKYPWRPSRCPEAFRAQWAKKRDAYLRSGQWEITLAGNTVPMMLIPKPSKDGGLPDVRTLLDLRERNKNTYKLTSPLTDMEGMLRRMVSKLFRTALDLKSAYEQIRIIPEHVERMSMTTPDGNMVSHVIQIGDCNAPVTYQALMNHLFSPYIGRFMDVYLDDIVIYDDDLDEHAEHVKLVLDILAEEKLYLSKDKLRFIAPELKLLGRVINDKGIRMDTDKVDSVLNWKVPTNRDLLRGFLGSVGYLADDVPGVRIPMGVLSALTGDTVPFRWTFTEQRAFEDVKQLVHGACGHSHVPLTYAPDAQPIWMVTDGSATGISGIVSQGADWKTAKVAAFYSAKLNSAQQNYAVHEIEMLAGIETMLRHQDILQGTKFKWLTDHKGLIHLLNQKNLSGRQARWLEKISSFDFEVIYIAGSENILADALSCMYSDDLGNVVRLRSEYTYHDVALKLGAQHADARKHLILALRPLLSLPDECTIISSSMAHENERRDRRPYLDELIARARADPLTVLAATDGSVPQSNQYQAASAAIIYKGHRELERTRYVSGRVTAPDAELNAISCAVRLAVKQVNCQHIMVFTDSMGSAHRAVDPSVHSGQAFSLSVCRTLQEWFEADDLCRVTFVYVPSALRWDIHGEAHKYVTELKVRVGRRETDNSIDALRSRAAHSVLDSWSSTFQDPTYRGSEFLELQQPDGRPLQPSYLNGGPWLSTFGHSITEFARVCRCITGHAPIGAYYRRFKINEPHGCTCGAALQSRQHILFRCRDRYSVHYPHFLRDIASFMKYNPTAFGFNRDPSGVG
ncbi:unnamed protein product [Cyclocybe aegerita]|uniref:Reverse transcriptase domain-containing protein n=1 Tax=Cyclocybe aegerita TaxID=1973307 RepID=A0A8S0WQB4_CYCAE|nr:unnamed protein product [Cyclocybe aegerita]